MTEENKHPIQSQEEIDEIWYKLWDYANQSITWGESHIEPESFIKEGKLLFDIKLKDT